MLLPITKKCNQKCLFCSVGDWKDLVKLPANREFLKWLIYQTKDTLIVTGGEPTLSPDFFWVLDYARKGCVPIELQTNALTLASKSFADRVIDAGVESFSVNFPSHVPRINDRLTRVPGSFGKRMAGLKNLQKHGVKICLTHVICSLNYRHLEEFVDFVKRNFSLEKTFIQFSFLKIMGFAQKNKQIILPYGDIIPYFLPALAKCEEMGMNFVVDNVAICNFERYKEHHVDFQKISSGEKLTYSLYERKKLKGCSDCRLSGGCCGVDKDYLDFFGSHKNVVQPIY